jgi:hypothetical protein
VSGLDAPPRVGAWLAALGFRGHPVRQIDVAAQRLRAGRLPSCVDSAVLIHSGGGAAYVSVTYFLVHRSGLLVPVSSATWGWLHIVLGASAAVTGHRSTTNVDDVDPEPAQGYPCRMRCATRCASQDGPMTSCCGAERRRPGRWRNVAGRLAVTVIGCAIGVCAACSSPDAATPQPASSSAPEMGGSSSRTMAPSQSHPPSACAQLQTDGRRLAETLDKYSAGQTSRVQVLAAAENLLRTAQDTLATTGGALRAQVERVQSAVQTVIATLRASPPPSAGKLRSAAQGVLNALKGLDRPCASPGASLSPTATP